MRRLSMLGTGCTVGALGTWVVLSAQPGTTLLLKQERDGMPAQNLTAAEFASLGDPFFNLVARDHANVVTLSGVEQLLQPDASRRRTFVVDERIADSSRGQSRRSVLAFTGSNGGEQLGTNVMLSVSFDSERFSDAAAIEAWGWDNHRSRYNYYKLDRTGTPDLRSSWKFRGSSDEADLLSSSDREGTCMTCHINGAPLMKELLLPWNNWHSLSSRAAYLTTAAPPATRWAVAADAHLARLNGAENLETSIISAVAQFNTRRLNAALTREDATGDVAVDADGLAHVKEGRRLLRPLFVSTEYNIISARQKSGLHNVTGGAVTGPGQDVFIPGSFFLNSALMIDSGGPGSFTAIGIQAAAAFSQLGRVTAQEYRALVESSGVRLGGVRGDADFAWLTPEPAHIDNDLVDRLLKRGVLTRRFVAAVLSVDLETPVFSSAREGLLAFIPHEFDFRPLAPGSDPSNDIQQDDLTARVIAAIRSASPSPGTPASQLLAALQSSDPIALLTESVGAYQKRLETALSAPTTRQAELNRLFGVLIRRRLGALNHDVLGNLNETGDALFPVP